MKNIRFIFAYLIAALLVAGNSNAATARFDYVSATSIQLSGTYAVNASGVGQTVSATMLNAGVISASTLYANGQALLTGDITPNQITANTDNWNPTGLSAASVVRASTDTTRNLTGLVGGIDGRIITLMNIGSNDLILKHDSTSTAANRFYGPSSQDVTMTANSAAILQYDSTSSRWRIIGAPGQSGSIISQFDSSGTWTKPANKSPNSAVLIQGWGGGGSGGNVQSGAPAIGGGSGGAYKAMWFKLSDLGSTETVIVGAGGPGTLGNPNQGSDGSPTTVGTVFKAWNGLRGAGRNGGQVVRGSAGGGQNSSGTGNQDGNWNRVNTTNVTSYPWYADGSYRDDGDGGLGATYLNNPGSGKYPPTPAFWNGGGSGVWHASTGDNYAWDGGFSMWGGAGGGPTGGKSVNGGNGGSFNQPGQVPGGVVAHRITV